MPQVGILEGCKDGAHLGFQCTAERALEKGRHMELRLTKGKDLLTHFQCFLTLETCKSTCVLKTAGEPEGCPIIYAIIRKSSELRWQNELKWLLYDGQKCQRQYSQTHANLHLQFPAGPCMHQASEMGLDTLRHRFRLQRGLSSAFSPQDSGITSMSPRKETEQ